MNTSGATAFSHAQDARLWFLDVGTAWNRRDSSIWSKMAPLRAPTLGAWSRRTAPKWAPRVGARCGANRDHIEEAR